MKLIDVVSFSGLKSKAWLIYKYPSNDLVRGTQLVVQEGQNAILIHGGKFDSLYTPGTHTLKSKNLPILKSITKIPFGNKTPFTTEIIFINTSLVLDVTWGTPDPIQLIDPKYNVKIRTRAFGRLGISVCDAELFLKTLVGALSFSEIVDIQRVKDYYRGIITNKVKSIIANIIINDKISALEISPNLEKISKEIQDEISPNSVSYGLEVKHFYIESINFPDEDFERINKALEASMEFNLLGGDRYREKRTFDFYETAAGNQNGVTGLVSAAAIGVGAMANLSGDKTLKTEQTSYCPICGATVNDDRKFCSNCGSSLTEKICKCGTKLSKDAKFCPNCGEKV